MILNNSGSMVSIINRNYTYEKVNTLFCNAHRRSRKSIIGKSLGDVWGPETFHGRIKDRIDNCFSGKTVKYNAVLSFPEALPCEYRITFRPVRSEPGKVSHILAETLLFTGSEGIQNDLIRKTEELRSLKGNYDTYIQLISPLVTVGLITEGIVHDFNNIITTINGYAELLRGELPSGSPLSVKVEKILTASERAAILSEKILNIGDPEKDEKTRFNINKLLLETADLVRSAAPPGIKFRFIIPEAEFLIFADQIQLFRVFLNMLMNAIQSMKKNGGTLSLKSEILPESAIPALPVREIRVEEYAHIMISDTGGGIERSLEKRIFEPFRGGGDKAGGRGLGLYIVKGIITEMNGVIKISTGKKSGTRFHIYLPVTDK